ncbi:MAG TPA: hypothetical protein VLL75_02755, partial [Vicinamibacteria bacterium]|nr:hypothetical protein [Vicinamibacteria bacterium]
MIVTSARQFLELTVLAPSRSPTCGFVATGVLRTVTAEASSAVWPRGRSSTRLQVAPALTRWEPSAYVVVLQVASYGAAVSTATDTS